MIVEFLELVVKRKYFGKRLEVKYSTSLLYRGLFNEKAADKRSARMDLQPANV
jgi:hypothetical protein